MIERLQDLFHRALELEPGERDAFIRRECGGDLELLSRLESFLGAHDSSDDFLANPTLAADGGQDESDQPIPETEAGTQIGRYTVVRPIGEGGYGVVLLAEQREPVERQVAIKVLKLGMDSQEVVARFEAERQALALMSHPEIATVLDGGVTSSGRPYFVMELVEGEPITDYCERRGLDVSARLALFARVCRAVQHAHQKGIIHRDIKPSNILVSDGQPPGLKVIDFGIAKATSGNLAERMQVTGLHQFVGTPTYVSPEQATRSERDVDTRSDIYSLGVLLYELLTGTTPIQTGDLRQIGLGEVLRRIREETPPKPSTRLATAKHSKESAKGAPDRALRPFSGDLDWIVMRAIEKDPARRYGSAEDFARDVVRFRENRPVEARPPSGIYRLRKLVGRHKASAVAVLVAVAALLAGLGMASYGLVRARDEAQAARLQADRANAVIRLINEMFESADPLMMRGSDYTVRQLLDDFGREFDGRLDGQEAVELSLRLTIGSAYEGLAENEIAESHYRRALELSKAIHGRESTQSLRLMRKIAWCLRHRGLYQDALAELEGVVSAPDSPLGLLETRAMMVDVERLLGHRKEANTLADSLGDTWRQSLARDDVLALRVLDILAMARSAGGQHSEAQRLSEDALELAAGLYGARHPRLIHPLDTIAVISETAGMQDRAVEFAERGRQIARDTLPADHPARLFAEARVEELSLATEPEAAAEKLVPMTAVLIDRIGERPDVFSRVLAAGVSLFARGKDDEAMRFFVERLGIDYEAMQTGQAITVEMAGPTIGRIIREGRVPNYISHIEKALAFAKQIWGEDGEHTVEIKRVLAYMYRWDGRFDEAEQLAREAYHHYRENRGQEHGTTINCASDLGDLLEEAGRLEDKWEFYLGDLDGTRDEVDTARLAAKLGRHLTGVGRRKEAQRLLEKALEIRRRAFGNRHPETVKSLRYLGHLYLLQNSTRGYTVLEEAVRASRALHGDASLETAKCVEVFGESCRSLTGTRSRAMRLAKEVRANAEKSAAPQAVIDRLTACIEATRDDAIAAAAKAPAEEQPDAGRTVRNFPMMRQFRFKPGLFTSIEAPPPFDEFRQRLADLTAKADADRSQLRSLTEDYAKRSLLVRGEEQSFLSDLWVMSQHLEMPGVFWDRIRIESGADGALAGGDDGGDWRPAASVSLVPPGSRWLCHNDAEPPSADWRTARFGDTLLWTKGDAPVTEAAPLSAGRFLPAGGEPLAIYLRTEFEVEDPADFTRLRVLLLHRSERVDLYLNGEKIVAAEPVLRRSVDLPEPLRSVQWESFAIDPQALRKGNNVLACATHRVAPGEKIYFECSLEGLLREKGS